MTERNADVSKTLTEQWKKGELPEGLYWVKHDGVINILDNLEISLTNVDEILGKVPSFNELQNMNKAVNECMAANIKLVEQNKQLKERVYEFAESNQSLRKQLDEEKAKNRIEYYNGSPMDYLDECERAMRKNKIYKNWINNISEELIISDLRRTVEGNKFIVNLLAKINQVLGEE